MAANNCSFGMCSSKAAFTGTWELIAMVASASWEGFDRAVPSVMTVRECGKEKGGGVTQESRATIWWDAIFEILGGGVGFVCWCGEC